MAVSGTIGYIVEPELRPALTGEKVKDKTDDDIFDPSKLDLTKLTDEQLPKYVMITKALQFKDSSSGLTVPIAVGTLAELVEVDNSMVYVIPKNTDYTIQLSIAGTDLMQQLRANPPKPPEPVVVQVPTPPVAPPTTPETPTAPPTTPVTPPITSVDPPAPPETPAVTQTPDPTPEPPAVTPTPTVTPSTPVADGNILGLMKASIANQEIKEFSSDQVTDWQSGAAETVEGVSYQTGTAFYTSQTPFGSTTMKAKALIRNGKVERWIWPHTGIQLK